MNGLLEELARVGLDQVRRQAYEEGIKSAIRVAENHPERVAELLKLSLRDAMSIGSDARLSKAERMAAFDAQWFDGRLP